ncbi:hypothetical protein IEQ34_017605 [Dendrobium chrysotoxum]|uniref:Uncharacterized protein n=1 Tax=Dendrobium chrysotoxum TaxID=161865 RepID=A0AAV7GA34_DENCH|nr:hypothetical protein IEQ34_017605 [Dendrobium chrysotoxum]
MNPQPGVNQNSTNTDLIALTVLSATNAAVAVTEKVAWKRNSLRLEQILQLNNNFLRYCYCLQCHLNNGRFHLFTWLCFPSSSFTEDLSIGI